METRKRSSATCKKHPKHRQSPGVCSLCLRSKLSKISSYSSRAITNVSSSSSSSSSSVSSISSVSSSHCSSNASSCTQSPTRNYRHRRKVSDFEEKGYLSFLKRKKTSVLKKSRSMVLVSERIMVDDEKKKGGFWSKLMGSKRNYSNKRSSEESVPRMIHSKTMREMFTTRV